MHKKHFKTNRLAWFLAGLFVLIMLLVAVPAASFSPKASAQVRTGQLCQGADLTLDGTGDCQTTDAQGHKISAEKKANKLIGDIVNFISVVVGILAVIMIIYAGFRYITSAGNPEATKSARNTILYAIIGLVIVALAQFIVKFVLGKLTQ